MLQTIVVAHDELHHDEGGEQRSERKVEPELSVAPQRLDLLLDHSTIEQREVDTRDEAEKCCRVLHPRRMEMLDTVVVDRVATRGCRRHGVVDALEPVHAKEHEAGHAAKGNEQIDEPNPFGTRRKSRTELALDRSGGLSSKHFRAAADHLRQYGNGEEHDSQTTYPEGQRPPEQDAVGQALHIVDDRGARCGESGHCLKVGISKTMEVATHQERYRAKEREQRPRERDDQIRVAARHDVLGIASLISEEDATQHGDDNRDEKGKGVFLAKVQSDAQTHEHHDRFQEKQRAQYLINDFKVDHTYSLLFLIAYLKTCNR